MNLYEATFNAEKKYLQLLYALPKLQKQVLAIFTVYNNYIIIM